VEHGLQAVTLQCSVTAAVGVPNGDIRPSASRSPDTPLIEPHVVSSRKCQARGKRATPPPMDQPGARPEPSSMKVIRNCRHAKQAVHAAENMNVN
jgi:hypothetical protein